MGSCATGLVGVLLTRDALKGDDEIKLLWNLTEEEIEVVVVFLFRGAMTGRVVSRPGQNHGPRSGESP